MNNNKKKRFISLDLFHANFLTLSLKCLTYSSCSLKFPEHYKERSKTDLSPRKMWGKKNKQTKKPYLFPLSVP